MRRIEIERLGKKDRDSYIHDIDIERELGERKSEREKEREREKKKERGREKQRKIFYIG